LFLSITVISTSAAASALAAVKPGEVRAQDDDPRLGMR
jgi:hypothetical protein